MYRIFLLWFDSFSFLFSIWWHFEGYFLFLCGQRSLRRNFSSNEIHINIRFTYLAYSRDKWVLIVWLPQQHTKTRQYCVNIECRPPASLKIRLSPIKRYIWRHFQNAKTYISLIINIWMWIRKRMEPYNWWFKRIFSGKRKFNRKNIFVTSVSSSRH